MKDLHFMGYIFRSAMYFFMTSFFSKHKIIAKAPKFDLKFCIAPHDVIGRTIFKRGNYEEGITSFMYDSFKFEPDQIFIDIGANIGWYSLIFSRCSYGPKRIFAFEPDNLNFSLLKENIQINNAVNIEAFPVALSNKAGNKNFYRYSSRNLGRHSLLPINNGQVTEVPSTTLDQFWDERCLPGEQIGLIKIDTEGYELQVVQGGERVLSRCPAVLAEYSPGYMLKGGMRPQDFLDFMFGLNFSPYYITINGNLIALDMRELYTINEKSINILWKKDFL